MRKPVQVHDENKEEDEEQEKDNEAFARHMGHPYHQSEGVRLSNG